ncbi:MAG TPA: hypothetical protein PKD05_05820, partial [Candidatus Melainabacteria bacterium]|nr:hypothetical protein [Candidatus Melainabacteria bacterium]
GNRHLTSASFHLHIFIFLLLLKNPFPVPVAHMEFLAQFANLMHDATMLIIVSIIIMTMIMSMFFYKILNQDGFLSDYNRNL